MNIIHLFRDWDACFKMPNDNLHQRGVSHLPLSELQPNDRAVVVQLTCGRMAMNRLAALGFTPGSEVVMIHNYGHGPLIVSVRGSHVALGRGEARHISVERMLP